MPEELVEVAVFHVLKHHVFMLKVGQQLSFALEILPGIFTGLLQRLQTHTHTHRNTDMITDWRRSDPEEGKIHLKQRSYLNSRHHMICFGHMFVWCLRIRESMQIKHLGHKNGTRQKPSKRLAVSKTDTAVTLIPHQKKSASRS